MILRKPYAFLIKNFRKINILLLALILFAFWKNLSLYSFVKEYVNTSFYNNLINSIDNYVNAFTILAQLLIIIISGILAYLLRYKNKPYAAYIFIMCANIVTFGFFLYTRRFFIYNTVGAFNLSGSMVVRDLLLISTIPYYVIIVILLVRSIGLDLKKFGFSKDKEFSEISEEDREEVEVEVAFNKDILIRKIKNKLRMGKYFFLEHKFSLSIIFALVLSLLVYNTYHFLYVENKIYNLGQTFKANHYRLTVDNTYLTDKDYAGNVISKDGKYYIVLDIKVENLLATTRTFDIENFFLFVDNKNYVPSTRYNPSFVDMGTLYTGKELGSKKTSNYLLIYEVDEPNEKANFLLTYQDLASKNNKVIKVKIKIRDIREFVNKDNSSLTKDMTIPINADTKKEFRLNTYELTDNISYTYEKCHVLNCPVYEGQITSSDDKTILYIRGHYGDDTTASFLSFMKKYGKIKYKIGDKIYTEKITSAINTDYRGNHLYLSVNKKVTEASEIDLYFTIRTYQYYYRIKGEE